MSGRSIKAALTAAACFLVVGCFLLILFNGTLSLPVKSRFIPAHKTVSGSESSDKIEESGYQSFEEYIYDTVFIGDSRTNALAVYELVPVKNVLAKDGENHRSARTEKIIAAPSGKAVTIAQAVAEMKPVRMMVSFGINGVSFMDEESFIEEYALFLDELHQASPDSIIIVQSILPVSKSYETQKPTLSNQKIDRYNKLLKQLAEQKGFAFLDSSAVLKDKNNALDQKYDRGDGLHYNKAAYEALLQFYNKNRIG